MNNQYAKFEYKRMKTVGDTDCTNGETRYPYAFRMEKCLNSTPVKMRSYLSNLHKRESAHFQYVNNRYAKFEYKKVKTAGITDYTNHTPSKHFWTKMSKFNNPKKLPVKIFKM